jgi:hypothetical protein
MLNYTKFVYFIFQHKYFYILSYIIIILFKTLHFIFLNCFDVLCNISFKEHLPEDGHNMWPKHVTIYAVYNKINVHICVCNC